MGKSVCFIVTLIFLNQCATSYPLSDSANLTEHGSAGNSTALLAASEQNDEESQIYGVGGDSERNITEMETVEFVKNSGDGSSAGNETNSLQKTEQNGMDVLLQVIFSKTGAIIFALLILVLFFIMLPNCCDLFEYYGWKKRVDAGKVQKVEDASEATKAMEQNFDEVNGNDQGTAV